MYHYCYWYRERGLGFPVLDTCLLRIDNTMLGCISLVQVRRHAGCIVFMEDSYLYTYREEERFVEG